MPHDTIDPIQIGANLVQQINQIVSRSVDPCQKAVISIGTFKSGTGANIIPEECEIMGTIRTFSEDVYDIIKSKLESICKGLEVAYGAGIDLYTNEGYPPTINTAVSRKGLLIYPLSIL